MENNASGVWLGAILAKSHEDGSQHSIEYASRTLQQHENNYAIME